MAQERVQKLMARANIASRRKSEEIILEGRVQVNGKIITLGDKADPQSDTITVDGQRLQLQNFETRYYVFHKPTNVLSTNKAPEGDDRSTVRELIPVEGHLFSIGRLDAESEGLIVLTNDGDVANKLSHPRYEHTKTYNVTVYGKPDSDTLVKWENGVWLDGTRTAPCFIRVIEENPETTTLRIIMIEGRKRQIRRVASMLGHPVKKLVRTHIGQLGLGTLRRGTWYRLEEEEVQAMLVPAEEVKVIRRKNKKFHGRTRFEDDDQ
jgi:pseudouridine synthase